MIGEDRERFLPAVVKACERIQPERQVLIEFSAFQQRRDRVRVTVTGYVAVVVINQEPILVARYSPTWAVKTPSTVILDSKLLSKLDALASGRAGAFIAELKVALGSNYVKIQRVNRNVAEALRRWLEARTNVPPTEADDSSEEDGASIRKSRPGPFGPRNPNAPLFIHIVCISFSNLRLNSGTESACDT